MKERTQEFLLVLAAVLAVSAPGAARAQGLARPFEGTWIFDPKMYLEAPNWSAQQHIIGETLRILRDDGRSYVARLQLQWDTGSIVYNEALAEDGAEHLVGPDDNHLKLGITPLPDGGRRIVSSSTETERYGISICHVSEDGMTMTCHGELHTPDGRVGPFQCGYHRDHATPVSWYWPWRRGAALAG